MEQHNLRKFGFGIGKKAAEQLAIYLRLQKLRDDVTYRYEWAQEQIDKKKKQGTINEASENREFDILHAYLNELDFDIRAKNGMPTVHVMPKTFRGRPFSSILDVKTTKRMATTIHQIVDSAAKDVIKGYGKGLVLSQIFGKDFEIRFKKFIKQRMQDEFAQPAQPAH